MGANSKIQWTDHTFNPWIGCSKVSAGCQNCYAEQLMDHRLGKAQWGDGGTRVRTSDAYWKKPLAWNQEAKEKGIRYRVFCASLADVFEDREELAPWRADLFDLIEATPFLDWLLLTKRPENILYLLECIPWAEDDSGPKIRGAQCLPWPNVRIGTSVENQEQANKRIPEILKVPAPNFLSMEPLLGPVDLAKITIKMQVGEHTLDCLFLDVDPADDGPFQGNCIDWVICGGESGHNARPMHPEWARLLRDQCQAAGVPFFFKQWGEWLPFYDRDADDPDWQDIPKESACVKRMNIAGCIGFHGKRLIYFRKVGKHAAGRLLNGREWNEFPEVQP